MTVLILIGAFVLAAILMLVCKGIYNALGSAADRQKKEADRAKGALEETRPEALADLYKKQ